MAEFWQAYYLPWFPPFYCSSNRTLTGVQVIHNLCIIKVEVLVDLIWSNHGDVLAVFGDLLNWDS